MKIQELLLNIKRQDFNLERNLEIKKYLPIEIKKTIAQGIIYESTNNEYGVNKIDSVQRYIAYVRYMITSHTCLEYSDEDYDVLCSTEYGETTLLNAIMECFGEDARECSRILNLMLDDLMQEMTFEFAVSKFLYGLNGTVEKFAENLNTKIDGFDLKSILPDGMDTDRLMDLLGGLSK